MEIKTEADSNDITECLQDDMTSTGMFGFLNHLLCAFFPDLYSYIRYCCQCVCVCQFLLSVQIMKNLLINSRDRRISDLDLAEFPLSGKMRHWPDCMLYG